jgi:tRNA pseudouridine38-40 synthase
VEETQTRRVRIDLQYDGTEYVGWQRQSNGKSIQEALETAIEALTGVRSRVEGAGRTDAGVHALGQVACFNTSSSIPAERMHFALNTELPSDIIVNRARKVPKGWDPRRNAVERRYRYTLDLGRTPRVTTRRYAYHIHRKLDVSAMIAAAHYFVGRHDFGAFRSADCDADHAVRTIRVSEFQSKGRYLHYHIHGHAFLRNMVRIIVGTLIEVGLGKRTVENVQWTLETRDRTVAGPTAPAKGLCLVRVLYPEDRHG